MDWTSAFPHGRRSTVESWTRAATGLAVGRNLLLWNVLVAHVSNDSLRAYFCPAGLSTFVVAYCARGAVPGWLQLAAVSTGRSNWFRRSPGSAAVMGYVRMGPLRGNRSVVERAGLCAGISSFADSAGAVGRCLRGQFPNRDSQCDPGFCSAQSQEERVGSLCLSPRLHSN